VQLAPNEPVCLLDELVSEEEQLHQVFEVVLEVFDQVLFGNVGEKLVCFLGVFAEGVEQEDDDVVHALVVGEVRVVVGDVHQDGVDYLLLTAVYLVVVVIVEDHFGTVKVLLDDAQMVKIGLLLSQPFGRQSLE
jgi:hypothetical protein